jgi:regulator of sirC expression with transglutaminase-like and TPR domain
MNLDAALALLAGNADSALDLAEVALLLARAEYATLDIDAYLAELNALAHEVRPRLRGPLEARTDALCRYLFHDLGFRGNRRDYYDPRNSYLNEVLDRRTGLPIALSAVAMAIGTRAGLTVVGVGLPGHFVAKAVEGEHEVIFDPFHGGRRLTPEECAILVEQTTGVPFHATPDALRPVPLGLIVLRMLTNLKGVYLRQGDFPRAVRVIEQLCLLSPDDVLQRRDLGAALIQDGRPGPSIAHLEAYLAARPDAGDGEAVGCLLRAARMTVAGWN